jgi:spore coat protein H
MMTDPLHSEIPSINVTILPRYLKELKKDIWNDDPQPAELKIDDKQHVVQLSYRGSYTRKLEKKSYQVFFLKPNNSFRANELHLNAEYLDPSIIRNKLSLDFFSRLGVLTPDAKHVRLFINKRYNGVYLQLESVDQYFLERRGLPRGPIYYAVNDNANFSLLTEEKEVKKTLETGYQKKIGCNEDDGFLRELIYKINSIPRPDFREEIRKYVDVTKYIQWLIGVICTQNYDGFTQNYALYRNSETGLFEMIPWDYDGTWGRSYRAKPMDYDYVPIKGFNTLTARILDVAEFRSNYKQRLMEILETEFTVDNMTPIVTRHYESLRPYVLEDPYKAKMISDFDQEPEYIIQFIRRRNRYLLENLFELD